VTYCSNSDMLTPERGKKCKAMLSVGHDEYWDIRQYEASVKMRDAGVNLLFLSGNSVCWVTPFTPSTCGRPKRIILAAVLRRRWTSTRSNRGKGSRPVSPMRGPDEGYLMGARNVARSTAAATGSARKPEHWIFAKAPA
jgi:hypothetical protein